MQGPRIAKAMLVNALIVGLALNGCTIPRSGPTAGAIKADASDPAYDMHVVRVTPTIAAIARNNETLGFDSYFVRPGEVSPDSISPGDTISVRVWENVDSGLLAGVGQKATTLEAIQVDQDGSIFVPYAGRIRAAGRSPDDLRRAITESLQGQTPDPQVEVRRVAGDGATVSVMGGVEHPGVFPIEAPTRRLSAMLAQAGGVSSSPDVAQVSIERSGHTGRIWLQDLYDNPSLDIALRPNDRIVVEEDRRSFTALGATKEQARVPFNTRDMSAVEALAATGGLDGRSADPTGVFVFREESSDVANRVLARTDLVGPQRVVYLLDMTSAEGVFSAREFRIRDGDTLYTTEAPLATWGRVLLVAGAAAALARSVDTVAN